MIIIITNEVKNMSIERKSYPDYILSHFINTSLQTEQNIIISTSSSLIIGKPFRTRDVANDSNEFFNSLHQITEDYLDGKAKNSTLRSGLHLRDVTIQSHSPHEQKINLPYLFVLTAHIVGISLDNLE